MVTPQVMRIKGAPPPMPRLPPEIAQGRTNDLKIIEYSLLKGTLLGKSSLTIDRHQKLRDPYHLESGSFYSSRAGLIKGFLIKGSWIMVNQQTVSMAKISWGVALGWAP